MALSVAWGGGRITVRQGSLDYLMMHSQLTYQVALEESSAPASESLLSWRGAESLFRLGMQEHSEPRSLVHLETEVGLFQYFCEIS